ncbi:MAG: ROK family protein [Clostridiales bacterium]|jgi:predicted NBD/HSP70 family sugar kinase|nr:ROK family protein [Clostridiales bacterium]
MEDQLALECIKEFIKYNPIGIVSLLHILNPEAVIIGGGGSM